VVLLNQGNKVSRNLNYNVVRKLLKYNKGHSYSLDDGTMSFAECEVSNDGFVVAVNPEVGFPLKSRRTFLRIAFL